MRGMLFFFWGSGKGFFRFFSCSHVPMWFPKVFQLAPQYCAIWVAQSSIAMYKLRSRAAGDHIYFYFSTWAYASHQCSQKIGDRPINIAPEKKKKKKL
jgi:hypothetical protein